ncbi:GspE/PulE family protein [Maricaulis sp.]|uniref:GspE/PulE family protein n=1 Tax=Maricaulis sp. TaxID=1486257 RepID=UPI0025BABE14|nr:GspE/PulE family protein [Maricaulis sp.]
MDTAFSRLQALQADGFITAQDVGHAHALIERSGEPLDHILTQLGLITETELADRFAGEARVQRWTPSLAPEPVGLVGNADINPDFLRHERVLPLGQTNGRIHVACVDPQRDAGLRGMAFALDAEIEPVVVTAAEFSRLYQAVFGAGEAEAGDVQATDILEDSDRLRDLASAAPTVRLANQIISRAVEARASDIHIEPGVREAEIRFRIDGVLRAVEALPSARALGLISRIKVLADLDIAERRRPQDGRVSLPVGGRSIDFRVSVVPAQHGESLVIRLLDPEASLRTINALGLPEQVRAVVHRALDRPHGLVLVTGPTGSGKTTSLYAFLRALADGERKILTIEDPIEYRLAGIAQSQTNALIGVTFASALRSFLRHDPDVVMVGEIRDAETARTAVQAAMTGHLVLSTLHTNDAPSAVARLLDMGVEDYLLASSLSAVLAQRLVRRVCPACGSEGCETCGGSGYQGRLTLAEGFLVDDEIRPLIGRARTAEMIAAVSAKGYRPMAADGAEKVAAGLTRDIDVRRAIGGG